MTECPLFQRLGLSEVRMIASFSEEQRLPAETLIGRRGEVGESLLFIADGIVRISTPQRGDEPHVELITTPVAYGWTTLVEPYRYLATAVTATDCRIVAISAPGLRALADTDEGLGFRLMHQVARVARTQLSATISRLEGREPLERQ